MDFKTKIASYKPHIQEALAIYFAHDTVMQNTVFGKDVRDRLHAFTKNGKMVRGGLVLLTYELTKEKPTDDIIKIAAALELFHTSLLIHDDIMDQDKVRRGNKTIFAQYEDFAVEKKLHNPQKIGESLGICVGDVGFFLGFNLINTTLLDREENAEVLKTITEELALVGLGQMQDVALGAQTTEPTEAKILEVYRLKTARYTFSLPFLIGAILADLPKQIRKTFAEIGENLGILFQIKDDELNIFGDEKTTGKSAGSDITENKKTLIRYYLFEQASEEQKKVLSEIFGNPVEAQSLEKVKKLIEELEVKNVLNKKTQTYQKKTDHMIQDLKVSKEYKSQLQNMLSFVINRSH